MPHGSYAQQAMFPAVSMDQLQVGDLVFWDGHVGIYVGGGSVLHAPHTGTEVQITGDLARRHRRRPPGLIRLTQFSHGAGCACKLSPADLRTVLGLVRGPRRPPTTRTCSSGSTRPTTPRSTACATTSRWW